MGSVLLAPSSIGSLTLNTSNVWDQPIIDTAFMTTEYDRYVMQTGKPIRTPISTFSQCSHHDTFAAIAKVKYIASAPSLKGYIGAPFGAFANTSTPAQTLKYIEVSSNDSPVSDLHSCYGCASELDRSHLAPCWHCSNRQEGHI